VLAVYTHQHSCPSLPSVDATVPFDGLGIRIGAGLHWVHVAVTDRLTYHGSIPSGVG
jgi:hypothetical protein